MIMILIVSGWIASSMKSCWFGKHVFIYNVVATSKIPGCSGKVMPVVVKYFRAYGLVRCLVPPGDDTSVFFVKLLHKKLQ